MWLEYKRKYVLYSFQDSILAIGMFITWEYIIKHDTVFIRNVQIFYFGIKLNNKHRLDSLKTLIMHPPLLECLYRQIWCPFLLCTPKTGERRICTFLALTSMTAGSGSWMRSILTTYIIQDSLWSLETTCLWHMWTYKTIFLVYYWNNFKSDHHNFMWRHGHGFPSLIYDCLTQLISKHYCNSFFLHSSSVKFPL